MTPHAIVSTVVGWIGLVLTCYSFAHIRRASGMIPSLAACGAFLLVLLSNGNRGLSTAAAIVLVPMIAVLLVGDLWIQRRVHESAPTLVAEFIIVIAGFLACSAAIETINVVASILRTDLPEFAGARWLTILEGLVPLAAAGIFVVVLHPLSRFLDERPAVVAGKLARRDREFVLSFGLSPDGVRKRAFLLVIPLMTAGMWLMAASFDITRSSDYVAAFLLPPAALALAARGATLVECGVLTCGFAVGTILLEDRGVDPASARIAALLIVTVCGVIRRDPIVET